MNLNVVIATAGVVVLVFVVVPAVSWLLKCFWWAVR